MTHNYTAALAALLADAPIDQREYVEDKIKQLANSPVEEFKKAYYNKLEDVEMSSIVVEHDLNALGQLLIVKAALEKREDK